MAPTESRSLAARVLDLWLAYIKGQFLISLLIGALTWVVSAGIGLPGAAVLGALAGVFETIPSLGPLIAMAPAVVIALWQGSSVIPVDNWVFALIVVGAYFAVQQIGNLFIEPHVMGRQLHLPPLLVLICVLAGAALGGVVGAYLAVPLAATVREVIQHFWPRRTL
jgi:predicted PurR-regulated permease PerM